MATKKKWFLKMLKKNQYIYIYIYIFFFYIKTLLNKIHIFLFISSANTVSW